MNIEDIIRLAKEAGFSTFLDRSNPMWGSMVASHEEIERFAALVAAAVLAEPEPITEDALREQLDTQDCDLWQRRADEEFLKEYEKRYRKLERIGRAALLGTDAAKSRNHPCEGEQMTRDELEQFIYGRTRDFVGERVLGCILELIAAEQEKEREACAKVCLKQEPFYGVMFADAIRARGEIE
jgi:hypothetical protein